MLSDIKLYGSFTLSFVGSRNKKGDEVIVPETTWIATAAAVTYVGATPVFADICSDTWVLDTVKIEKLITSKTKAIIPVHLYGQPVEMDNLLKLANKYNLKVIEDAAPSIGTIYRGKKTGSFGDMAAFSFQGAKAVVAGEGGILVSNNKDLIDKAWFYNDHCRDVNRPLCNSGIGYKLKMSNIQASIALAQMEKVEEIVAKKSKFLIGIMNGCQILKR
jgi:perosamine synthetase